MTVDLNVDDDVDDVDDNYNNEGWQRRYRRY